MTGLRKCGILSCMRQSLFIRPLTDDEQQALRAGLRASDAFVLRRCQILLASNEGYHAQQIADQLHCDDETVRRAIKAFNMYGVAALAPSSSRPHRTRDTFSEQTRARLKQIPRRSPRTYGYDTSIWTLGLLAEVAYAEGLTPMQVSDETIRAALKRLGITWRRAKHWITSPDPNYAQKNSSAIA
jgi:transposase